MRSGGGISHPSRAKNVYYRPFIRANRLVGQTETKSVRYPLETRRRNSSYRLEPSFFSPFLLRPSSVASERLEQRRARNCINIRNSNGTSTLPASSTKRICRNTIQIGGTFIVRRNGGGNSARHDSWTKHRPQSNEESTS